MRPDHKAEMKERARNICLVVAYDGTRYHGFQRQTPPVVAVQNVLEERLAPLFGDSIELAAAGRTDAGVHALGQVVNFFTDGRIPIERVVRAANDVLPRDIVVRRAFEADRDFSALHSAREKTYRYRILRGETPNPFERDFAWYVGRPLDTEAMAQATASLVGTHDFSSFRAAGGAPMSPVRTMLEAVCREEGDLFSLRFRADGFLYHMVRNIVGTLVNVGLGRLSPEGFADIMEARDRKRAGATAPATGLCLLRVDYDAPWYRPMEDIV